MHGSFLSGGACSVVRWLRRPPPPPKKTNSYNILVSSHKFFVLNLLICIHHIISYHPNITAHLCWSPWRRHHVFPHLAKNKATTTRPAPPQVFCLQQFERWGWCRPFQHYDRQEQEAAATHITTILTIGQEWAQRKREPPCVKSSITCYCW